MLQFDPHSIKWGTPILGISTLCCMCTDSLVRQGQLCKSLQNRTLWVKQSFIGFRFTGPASECTCMCVHVGVRVSEPVCMCRNETVITWLCTTMILSVCLWTVCTSRKCWIVSAASICLGALAEVHWVSGSYQWSFIHWASKMTSAKATDQLNVIVIGIWTH